MKYVFVLEDDPKFQIEILEALRIVSPQVQLRFFQSLDEFHAWLKLAVAQGPLCLSAAGRKHPQDTLGDAAASKEDILSLVVSKDEFLGSRQMSLLSRTVEMFIRKGFCTREDPTSLIITAFDNPDFDIKLVEQRFINNVIFKPFDKLILQQHLLFGIEGRHPAKASVIHNMKTDSTIEMLKDIEFEGWSELGFITRSDRQIPEGAFSKYYVKLPSQEKEIVVFAKCFRNRPHPQYPAEFRSYFHLFAPATGVLNLLRKNIPKEANLVLEKPQEMPVSNSMYNCVLLDHDANESNELAKTLNRVFFNVATLQYQNFSDFMMELDPEDYEKSNKRKKAWGNDNPFKFYYDSTGAFLIKTEPDLGEIGTCFGMKKKELLRLDLLQYLTPEDKIEYRKFILGQQFVNTQFRFTVDGEQYFVQVMDRQMVQVDGKNLIEITMRELTVDERCQLLKKASRLGSKQDIIFVHEAFLGESFEERWTHILQKMGKPKMYILGQAEKGEIQTKALSKVADDIFYRPFDIKYFLRKLYSSLPDLKSKDDHSEPFKEVHFNGKVANPIHISEVSEAGLVMNYYRPLELGVFREFILWLPNVDPIPIVLGTCNFHEESKVEAEEDDDGKSKGPMHDNHFVFFGVQDAQLKHIRLWLRDAYIHSKSAGGN